MSAVPDYLLAWAAMPGPRRVLAGARDRAERGQLGPRSQLEATLSPEERAQVGQLMPPAWAGSALPVLTRDLRSGLHANGATLEQLLVAVGGPLRDLRAEREQRSSDRRQDRSAGLARLATLLGEQAEPPDPTAERVLRRCLASASSWAQRAEEIAHVVEHLPAPGEGEALAMLAARVLGDAHALDQSRALGRAVCRFLSLRAAFAARVDTGLDEGTALVEWSDPVGSAEAWRAAWASAGVVCDSLSSQVLALNLPLRGTATCVALASVAAGEPVWFTLRSLTGGEVALATGVTDVFVCENPSVVEAAADRLGTASLPLVCTFGRPGVAAWRLLEVAARSASVWIRADGDAAGWSIVAALESRIPGARRWRMPPGTTAYEEELVADLVTDLDGRAGEPAEGGPGGRPSFENR